MPSALNSAALAAPRLQQAFIYWQTKSAGRPMPARRDIDPADIPKLLPYVMLIDVLPAPLDFHYRLIGTGVRSISCNDYTGRRFSELPARAGGAPSGTIASK